MSATLICKPIQIHFKFEDEDLKDLKPFCKLKIGRSSVESSRTKCDGIQAEWAEPLKLAIKPDEDTAKLSVKHDRRGRDKKLGKVKIDLVKLQSSKKMTQWFHLTNRSGDVTGEILVELEYVPDSSNSFK